MSSNTPFNNFRNEFNKFKRETERKFQKSHDTFASNDDLTELVKNTGPFIRKLPMIETSLRQLSGFLQNITQQMVTLEKRVTELEEAQRGGQGGGAGFRMKKSMSRKRNPKKKSRTAKRGKKEKKDQ